MSEFKVEGIEQTLRELKKLPERIQKNVYRTAFFRIAQHMRGKVQEMIVSMGAYQTGELHKSVKARRGKTTNIETRAYTEVTAWYGRLVEHGFMHVGGKHIGARPFTGAAFDQEEESLVGMLEEQIGKELDIAFQKMGAK